MEILNNTSIKTKTYEKKLYAPAWVSFFNHAK